MADPSSVVRVGVGVFVLQSSSGDRANPRFLLGKRKGSVGAGTYALPGGHLEVGESFEECAAREVLEETGLKVRDIAFLTATNSFMQDEGKHYVTIFMLGVREDEQLEAEVMEPEKCEGWDWTAWSELLSMIEGKKEGRVFQPLVNLMTQRGQDVLNVALKSYRHGS